MAGRGGRRPHLALQIQVAAVPKGTTWRMLLRQLEASIHHGGATGDYSLPDGWQVTAWWRNGSHLPWRHGPWKEVMEDSAEAGRGWDQAWIHWINRQRRNLGEPEPPKEKPEPIPGPIPLDDSRSVPAAIHNLRIQGNTEPEDWQVVAERLRLSHEGKRRR